MTKTFMLLTFGLLASGALGQGYPTSPGYPGGSGNPGGTGNPGGSGNPGDPPTTQGSWVIQFKGQVYDQYGQLIWNRTQYSAYTAVDDTREVRQGQDSNGIAGIGSTGSIANVHGAISVRRHWVGNGTPTPAPNFKVHSTADASAFSPKTASASNGYSSQSGQSASTDDFKLVQPGGGGDGETTVSFSTSGDFGSFFVGAVLDSRYASITLSGAENSKKLSLTGVTKNFTIPESDEPKTVSYAEAVPVTVEADA